MQADEPVERVRAAYGAETFERLRAVKQRYDPANTLRFNQNIPARLMAVVGTRGGNQPPPLADYNLYEQDAALVEALRREGGGDWEEQVRGVRGAARRRSARVGPARERASAAAAHARPLRRADRRDGVPSRLGRLLELGLDARRAVAAVARARAGAHVARAALFMLLGQVEAGVGCPLSMTFAAVPARCARSRDLASRVRSRG